MEDPRIISALFIFLKMAYYNVLINTVTYNPDCEFVIATVNAQSGVTNVTTGSISDVKKQSEVYLYGEFADTNHFNATKVVIAHWE